MKISTIAALVIAATLAAGCTQKSPPTADNPVVSAPSGSTLAPPTVTATTTVPTVTVSSPPPSSRPPSSPHSSSPSSSSVPIDGPGGCPTSSLKVSVLRGSGAAGHQYAFLQFTNTSAKSCSLTGFPGVQLLKNGVPLGLPAARSSAAVVTVQIAAGAAATAQLIDDSTCNADNADSVQVIPPNRTDKIVLPISLRGCPLHVGPVAAT